MLAVVDTTDDTPLTLARDEWLAWLKANPAVGLKDAKWTLWNRYAPRLAVSETQRRRLELILRIAANPPKAEGLMAEWPERVKPNDLPPPGGIFSLREQNVRPVKPDAPGSGK